MNTLVVFLCDRSTKDFIRLLRIFRYKKHDYHIIHDLCSSKLGVLSDKEITNTFGNLHEKFSKLHGYVLCTLIISIDNQPESNFHWADT